MSIARWLACVCLAATLPGCRALPALHYYELQTVSPDAVRQAGSAPTVRIRHVGLPPEMDHLGLTHRAGPAQLVISDDDHWSAPLEVLIQGTLTRDLGARLGYERVVAAGALPPASPPTLLDLDFVVLSADERCGISAEVSWTLASAAAPPRRGIAHLAAAAAGCPAGLPAALSAALGDLADQLVAQLTTP